MLNLDPALVNYQAQGCTTGGRTINEANAGIHAAKAATPKHLHHLYRSWIRWNGTGYTWTWSLK